MFHLNPNAGAPIYRQLVDQIRRLVAGGHLRPGDALPSVRELAVTHAVNPMTISKAYNLLEAEGILERHRGKPMTVAPVGKNQQNPQEWLHTPMEQLVHAARDLGLSDDELMIALKHHLKNSEPQ